MTKENNQPTKVCSFRLSDETLNRFKTIQLELKATQNLALETMMSVFENCVQETGEQKQHNKNDTENKADYKTLFGEKFERIMLRIRHLSGEITELQYWTEKEIERMNQKALKADKTQQENIDFLLSEFKKVSRKNESLEKEVQDLLENLHERQIIANMKDSYGPFLNDEGVCVADLKKYQSRDVCSSCRKVNCKYWDEFNNNNDKSIYEAISSGIRKCREILHEFQEVDLDNQEIDADEEWSVDDQEIDADEEWEK